MKKALLVLGFFVAVVKYAPAQDMSVISGKLFGYDGEPMLKAHIQLYSGEHSLQTMEVAPDGSFEIKFIETGLLRLLCTGVSHYPLFVPLLVEKPLHQKLTIRLKLYEYVDDFSQLKITYDFLEFNKGVKRPMIPQADGTFLFELDTTDSTFAYQIFGAEKNGRSVNDTQADDFVYVGGGYHSVVKVNNGKVKIIFNPKKLLRGGPDDETAVQFEDLHSFWAQFYALTREHERRKDRWYAARKAYRNVHKGDQSGFSYDWSKELEIFPQRIIKEKTATVRQILLEQYLELGIFGAQEKLDKKLVRQAFAEIPATSILWGMNSFLMMQAVQWSSESGKYDDYVNEALEKHPDREVRATILFTKLEDAAKKGDTVAARIFYNRLNEFGDLTLAQWAKTEYDPNRAVMKGKALPAFSVTSLDQPDVTYTNEAMKGKIYLVDFWAVWCGPCIQEMPNLHQAHDKFKDRNFEILSLSFDEQPEDIAKFRSGKWKMPWLHAFVEKGFSSDLAKIFEVKGIPKPILVDGNTNVVIASGEDLLGEQLEKTLTAVLGEKTVVGSAEKR